MINIFYIDPLKNHSNKHGAQAAGRVICPERDRMLHTKSAFDRAEKDEEYKRMTRKIYKILRGGSTMVTLVDTEKLATNLAHSRACDEMMELEIITEEAEMFQKGDVDADYTEQAKPYMDRWTAHFEKEIENAIVDEDEEESKYPTDNI